MLVHLPAQVDISTMEVLIHMIYKVFWVSVTLVDEAMVEASTVILIQ